MILKVDEAPLDGEESIDFLWRAFTNLNDWVRFSDAKAAAVLAADGVFVGAAATVASGNRVGDWALRTVALWCLPVVIAIFVSAVSALGSLLPQLSIRAKHRKRPTSEEAGSLIFFGDIERNFPSSSEFHRKLTEATKHPAKASEQLTQQVWANSRVAVVKYHRVTTSLYALGVSVLLTFAGLVSLLITRVFHR